VAGVLGGKDFRQLQLRGRPVLPSALFIFIQQVPNLVDRHRRILAIQRFLTFSLISELMLVGEGSARGHVVRIVGTVNVANGRCCYRLGDICDPILGRGNFGFGPNRARRILRGSKRVRIDE